MIFDIKLGLSLGSFDKTLPVVELFVLYKSDISNFLENRLCHFFVRLYFFGRLTEKFEN
jgi:hypothetical protein